MIETPNPKGTKTRAGVKRVKTGCITCRIRRVKCDEAHPHCERCTSTGRQCDGYSSLPFSGRDLHAASSTYSQQLVPSQEQYEVNPLSRLVTDPAFGDILEKRYFQFFKQRTVLSTNSTVASHFWARTVLQACHNVPAVKHAVLALSSWHQYSDSKEARHRIYADSQYQLALKHAHSLLSSAAAEDIDKILIACIVFICYEGVRKNFKAAQLHMDNGRAICKRHRRQAARRNDMVEIQETLARLDLPAVAFSDRSAPYHYTVEDFLETDPILIPWEFKNVYEARSCLIDLCRWMMVIGHYIDPAYLKSDTTLLLSLEAQKNRCSERLRDWRGYFEKVVGTADASQELLVLNLQQWYYSTSAISTAMSFGPETRWDAVEAQFVKVVEYGEEIVRRLLLQNGESRTSFSYDVGYTMSVFLVATRCRNPGIRRRAIGILRATQRQEGVWASIAAAAVAQRWMEIEEEGLVDIVSARDVPEWKRVRFVQTHVLQDQDQAVLRFTVVNAGGDGYVQRAEQVSWGGDAGHNG